MDIVDSSVRLNSENGGLNISEWLELAETARIVQSIIARSDEFVAVFNERGIVSNQRTVPDTISGGSKFYRLRK